MKKLITTIRRAWRYFVMRSVEIELDGINRLLQESVGERETLLRHREQTRKELAHARAMWLLTLEPGKRRFFEVA